MPGTNQTEYQGGTVKVQQPTGGTWSSFLWNMPIITKDQVNHIEEYTDINAQIREEQSDGKSYLDMAKECFREIFGQGYEEENFPFTKETVDKAMTNMYVDGQTYRERFEIGDITEDNYELAICHMYFQMTTGAIAASHQRNGLEMYGGPMKVTVLNTSTATAKLFTAVVPQEPKPVEEPRQPNGWKRFWNRFGFYKKDMQTYQNKLNQYNDYVADKAVYDENVRKTQAEAEQMEQKLVERDGISEERRNQVHAVMRNQEKRRELHEAAKEVFDQMPSTNESTQLAEVKQYIPDYDDWKSKPFMSGMGRPGSLRNQILAYMAAANDMTLEEALAAPLEMKQKAGGEFKKLFMEKKNAQTAADRGSAAQPNAPKTAPELDREMDEAADALAKIYTHWGKEQIKPVDVLDPKSIRENAAHDIQLGLIGMDIGHMLKDGVELTKRVKDRMGENFAEKKSAFGAARAASGPLQRLCSIYRMDEFKDGNVPVTVMRPTDAATALFCGERIDNRIAGKCLKDMKAQDINYVMAASKMDDDTPEDICNVLNGNSSRIPGKLKMNYMVRCASERPLKVAEEPERRRISIDELAGQNVPQRNAAVERQRRHTPNQRAVNQPAANRQAARR